MIALLNLRLRKVLEALRSWDGRRALVRQRVVSTVEHGHLRTLTVHTVLDVGANRGQFALFAAKAFPDARIICFEPGRAAFQTLLNVTHPLENVECHELALGDEAKTANLSITRADDSSSLLVPTTATQADARGLEVVASAEVPVQRLDRHFEDVELQGPVLLKVDVQGTELDVLQGAAGLLPGITFVYVEVSYIQFYNGQPLAGDVFSYVLDMGFSLRGLFNPSVDSDGQLVQVDALFVR